jgi:GNAT superfamily N-acetyltransferase
MAARFWGDKERLPGSFIIRPVEPNDRPRWEPLWRDYQTNRTIPDDVTEVTWRRFLDSQEPMHALVAEREDALIGFAHYLFHRSTGRIESICYLQDMFTAEAARRLGVARALIEAVRTHAEGVGASRVYWHTGEKNTAARALYDQVATLTGFVQYRQPV